MTAAPDLDLEALPWQDRVELIKIERAKLMLACERSPDFRGLEMAICARDPLRWLTSWCYTLDPREPESSRPFILWRRQAECFEFMRQAIELGEERVIAKSRDQGYSWLCCALAVHGWLFRKGFIASFGSRVETDVDQKGNPKSLFEKIRYMIDMLPEWMRPTGYHASRHSSYMRIQNPENGSVIVGEVGAQMGRGGRSSVFWLDEAAFIDQDQLVDRAVSANSNARIWGSTANGRGNVFAEKWHSGRYPTFRLHFRDDPRKGPNWEAEQRRVMLPHTFASEYDIDFAASVEGILIEGAWISAARTLYQRLGGRPQPSWGKPRAGLDIGAGRAESVLCARVGPLVLPLRAWMKPDSIETAHKAVDAARALGVEVISYDSTPVGEGVKAAFARIGGPPEVVPVNTGVQASDRIKMADGRTAKETFGNLRAQLGWMLRERFKRTYEYIVEGIQHPLEELIALPPDEKLETQCNLPIYHHTTAGKIMLDSKKDSNAAWDRYDALALSEHDPQPARAQMIRYRMG